MNLKGSRKTRGFAILFICVGIISFLGGILLLASDGTKSLQTSIMWFISGVLWTICGIILLVSAKRKKKEEEEKPKITAFNYGKKNLHKKAKR